LDAGKLSLSGNTERSPQTRTQAASLNAAAAVTGLKPWSREWVFEGNDAISQAQGRDVKPLFGEGSGTEAKAKGAATPAGKETSPISLTEPADPALAASLAGASAGLVALAKGDGKRGDAGAEKTGAKRPVDTAAALNTGKQQAGQAPGSAVQQQALSSSGIAQAPAASAATEEAAVLAGLAALNGDILSDSGDVGPLGAAAQPAQLSGAEFLSALSAGRMAAKGSGEQDSSNLSGQSGQGGNQFGGSKTLRALDGGRKATGPVGSEVFVMGGVEPLRIQGQVEVPPTAVDGRVTQGSMTRNRLTSESLLNMTNGIRDFAGAGGGEMRVRLKPDNLGELHVRVLTRGNDVKLQIQASDEKAKKILEESMPHLKDKLASQNLNLGRVEVSLAPQSSNRQESGSNQYQQSQQHSMNDWMGQDQGRGQGAPDRWAGYDPAVEPESRVAQSSVRPGISALTGGTASSAARGNQLESGRLDVRA